LSHHLTVVLYDSAGQASPPITDEQAGVELQPGDHMPYFDLNRIGWQDSAAFISMTAGPDYQSGDHLHLLDWRTDTGYGTDTVAVDPVPFGQRVSLSDLIHGDRGFQRRAALVRFVYTPGVLRDLDALRLDLWDMPTAPRPPSLFFFDWQPAVMTSHVLAQFNFAGRARLGWLHRVDGTPDPTARVSLFDVFPNNQRTRTTLTTTPAPVDLGAIHDLDGRGWADRCHFFQFERSRP